MSPLSSLRDKANIVKLDRSLFSVNPKTTSIVGLLDDVLVAGLTFFTTD